MTNFIKYCFLGLVSLISFGAHAQWINEIHYDNDGTDSGECVEIVAPAGTDMSCIQLILYNGSNGQTYYTHTFTGTMSDDGCGYGTVADCSMSSIQNGAPDGMILYNSCSSTVIQFISYEGTFTATNGPANGMTSTNIGVSESGGAGNPVGSSMQLIGSGANYSDFTWDSSGSTSSFGTLNSGQSIAPCGVSNTITPTPGSVTGGPFTVDCSGPTTDSGTIDFTTVGSFNSGNTFTAQLTNGTVLGTFSADGTDPSGTISLTFPASMSSGTYDIEILADNPNGTSSTTVSISVIQSGGCTPPHLTSVIINSCNSTCQEGQNELVFGSTGDYSVQVTEANFNFSYTNVGALDNFTDNLTSNTTTTQDINDLCPSTDPFIDAYGTTIPPNSSWVLANDLLCPSDALDWSGLCNSGPIYIIYSTDTDWLVGGNFSNTTSDFRPYQTSITTTDGQTFTIDYETDGSQYANSDGVYATFDSDGGLATSYGDNDCQLDPVVLPVELSYFSGFKDVNGNVLYWETATEKNNSHFTVMRSSDGINWISIGTIYGNGTTLEANKYQLIDRTYNKSVNYYKLWQYDYNGAYKVYSTIVTIRNEESQKTIVSRFNSIGQPVDENYIGVQIIIYDDGTSEKVLNL